MKLLANLKQLAVKKFTPALSTLVWGQMGGNKYYWHVFFGLILSWLLHWGLQIYT